MSTSHAVKRVWRKKVSQFVGLRPLQRRGLHYDGRNRLSHYWAPTQSRKNPAPGHSDDDGHDLLVRAGFLRQAHAGIFHLLPLGLRVQSKVEALIDKHMQWLGASKVALSSISSQDLWEKSGRFGGRDSELFQLKDRKDAKYLLAPTHEEEITTIVKNAVHSYKDLPLRLYQVTRKYRDEARPRQGLLRGREFVMKDLYTFDLTQEHAMETYKAVSKAYRGFLEEMNIPYLVANADSGSMGGDHSHEYHFASARGEDTIIKCTGCDLSINEELFVGNVESRDIERHAQDSNVRYRLVVGRTLRPPPQKLQPPKTGPEMEAFEEEQGQDWEEYEAKYDEELQEWKANPTGDEVRIYLPDGRYEVNPHAIKRLIPALDTASLGTEFKANKSHPTIYIRDPRVPDAAIKLDGLRHLSKRPEIQEPWFLLTKPRGDDPCPSCSSGKLVMHKAVEIGHTFHLGTRYSKPLEAAVQDDGNSQVDIEMGCHGIGVSRLVGAVASLLADQKGLNWPVAIAPFAVVIIGTGNASANEVGNFYDYLCHHIKQMSRSGVLDAVIDDRERPVGWKLNDADLIGYPFIVVLGKAWAERKAVELQCRRLGVKEEVSLDDLVQKVVSYSERL